MKKAVLVLIFILSFLCVKATDVLRITAVEINNNKEIPEEVIENNIKLKEESEFSSKQMVEDYITLKNLEYIEDLKIYPEIYNKGIKLKINIIEKENAKELLIADEIVPLSEREKIDKSLIIKSIGIVGNVNISEEEIIKNIPIAVGGYFSKMKVVEGKNNIMDTGYFKDVNPNVLKYNDGIYIKYQVIENPIINGISITGNRLIDESELLEGIETEIGKIYNVNTLKRDTDLIMQKYHDKGYVLANIADLDMTNDAILHIKIIEGKLTKIEFKKMVTEENAHDTELKTRGYVLKREVELEVGEVFEINKFQDTVKNIFRTGYFKTVNQEFNKSNVDPEGVELILLLDENKSGSIQGSLSYGSAVGVVGSVSINDNNFRGKSQTVSLSAEISSEKRKLYELSFSDPWLKDTDRLSFNTGIYKKIDKKNDKTETDKLGFKIGIGKGLGRYYRVRLGTNLEKVKEYDSDRKIDITSDYGGDYNIIKFGPSFYYDTRNNYLNATNGNYARLTIEHGKVFGGKSYFATELEGRKYHRFLFDKMTMAYRGILAGTGNNTPSSQLYDVGGGNSLRGYRSGEFEDGYIKFVGNIENRIQIENNFQLVFFYDIGRTWENSSIFKEIDDIKQSYGIGLRIDTPLGPLRFDYGWVIGDKDKTSGEFHFNIGQMF